MEKTTITIEGIEQPKIVKINLSKTIRKIGNSIGILLDNIVTTMGFSEGTPIQIKIGVNEIIITPEELKTHKSVIKYLRKKGPKIIPEFFDKTEIQKESARFEDVYSNRTEQFSFLISYDHVEKKYLLIYAKKKTGGRTVRYITEEVYQGIKEGKNPENYFIMKE